MDMRLPLTPDPTLPPRTGLWLVRCTYISWGLTAILLMLIAPNISLIPIIVIFRLLCGGLILSQLVIIMLFARQRRWVDIVRPVFTLIAPAFLFLQSYGLYTE